MIIAIAIVIGSVLQRSAGLGFALIVAPTAVVLIGPVGGVMLVNLLAVVSSSLVIPAVWPRIDWRRYAGLAAAAVPGVALGAWLTTVLARGWLEITIGSMLLGGLILTVAMPRSRRAGERPLLRYIAGGAAGVMSATAGAGGPAIVAYATVAKWPFRTLAATIQPYFITVALFALAAKLVGLPDQWPALSPMSWLLLAASLIVGAGLAHLVARRIPERVARVVAFVLACLGACTAIARGWMAMQ
jgi:uncharacterized membrane protein YfcA